MKIFLTGASGFIGKKFAILAAKKGNYVYAPTRKKNQKNFKHKNIKWLIGDFDKDWKNELTKSDILVHIAADGVNKNFSKNIYEVNIFKSLKLFKNAIKAGCKKWLIVSTSSEYGNKKDRQKLTLNTNRIPDSDYGLSKAIFSDQSQNLAKKFNCQVRIMRAFPTFGIGENTKRLFPSLLKAIRKNEDFIIKNPFEKRDFSNVNFVSKIILDSLNFEKKKFKNCQIWHISQNEPKYVKKFAKILWKKHRARGRLIFKKNSKRFFTHISDISSLWKL